MGVLDDTRIAFIGGGAMAEAFISGILRQGLVQPHQIVVSDPIEGRRAYLAQELGIRAVASNAEAVTGAQIIVLAVKPQMLGKALGQLGQVAPDVLLLTFVTGATISNIRKTLGVEAIVRIMPNTPSQIGEGISVWTATAKVTPEQRDQARQIVQALGEEIYVEDESYLDMATAMSGSGPAYVFLFIEAFTDAGVHLGLSRPIAEKLALQTVRGAAIYAQKKGAHPAVLRNQVTSPGGTTAEALQELEKGAFRAIVANAVRAAYLRAKALGGDDK